MIATLLGLRGDIGALVGRLDAQQLQFGQHLVHHAKLTEKVVELEVAVARQRTTTKIWGGIAAAAAAIGAGFIHLLLGKAPS